MREIKLTARGKTRRIVVPSAPEKVALRAHGAVIAGKAVALAAREGVADVAHGFMTGRSPVTMAMAHRGYRWTLSMDLRNFFDTVTSDRVGKLLSAEERQACLYRLEGAVLPCAAQGLPSSPAVANLAAVALDRAVSRGLKKLLMDGISVRHVYTRYADDLVVSYDDDRVHAAVRRIVAESASRCGFQVHPGKTHLAGAHAGRREVVGVMVDDDIHAPRSVKRRLRAALHQKNMPQARGLAEWVALKPPRDKRLERGVDGHRVRLEVDVMVERQRVADALTDAWGLKRAQLRAATGWPEATDGGYVLTADPAYVLGMSTYTVGWGSCMTHRPNPMGRAAGIRRQTTRVHVALGTRVAALLTDRSWSVAGVERRLMRARCLVWRGHRADGTKVDVYDRIYTSDPADAVLLERWLVARGAVSAGRAKSEKVSVSWSCADTAGALHFDSLRGRRKGGRIIVSL